MKTCKRNGCDEQIDKKELERVHGEFSQITLQGYCSAQCYTKDQLSGEKPEKDMFENFITEMDAGLTRYAVLKEAAPVLMGALITATPGGITTQEIRRMAKHAVDGANALADELLKFDPVYSIPEAPDDSDGN